MSNRRRSQGIRVKYEFIKPHRSEFDTAVMRRLFDVSRSGFCPTSLPTPNTRQRGSTVQRPNKAWVIDITYMRTWEGWLYLAVVMDLSSPRIVGWATKHTVTKDLCWTRSSWPCGDASHSTS